jgi:hypothetical protein
MTKTISINIPPHFFYYQCPLKLTGFSSIPLLHHLVLCLAPSMTRLAYDWSTTWRILSFHHPITQPVVPLPHPHQYLIFTSKSSTLSCQKFWEAAQPTIQGPIKRLHKSVDEATHAWNQFMRICLWSHMCTCGVCYAEWAYFYCWGKLWGLYGAVAIPPGRELSNHNLSSPVPWNSW